jgi:hypothetical protein
MEHSVDLSAKNFVQAVSPSSARKIIKKMKSALRAIDNDNSGSVDLDDIDTRLADFNLDNDNDDDLEGDDEDDDDLAELQAADSVGKALLLVKQVCPSFALAGELRRHSCDLLRYVLLPRLGLSSRSLASRLKYLFCSYFCGSTLAGLLCTRSWTDF